MARTAATAAAPKSARASATTANATTLTISSKNYSSWSLRGWLVAKFSGIEFETIAIPPDDAAARAEILLLSPSILVPCLNHGDIKVWDTLAITEYLNELYPKAGLLPATNPARTHCRSICGEMHSGFSSLRSALPMNLRGHFPNFKVWSRAQGDIERIVEIWRDCLATYGGPYLFGKLSAADAMYAPVVTRFVTYDVHLDPDIVAYCRRILDLPEMREWIAAAREETEDIDELDVEF